MVITRHSSIHAKARLDGTGRAGGRKVIKGANIDEIMQLYRRRYIKVHKINCD